ncbi:hypothetical protein ZIOFF_018965 [Zingiber officinale]|uniref:Uncharacterized protein n=1 Tax=Zingiber officinale TaxID=94328 RepID=A0A8J5LBC2_ZINOF|nr:hypothetical protein ZIOFF_018965 [Zingiber officinale]
MENHRAYERNRETSHLFASSSLALPPREYLFLKFTALPLWDDTMGNQTPLRGFGDFDLDELDFGDEVDKGMEEANEASRVKRHRVLNFFSDDDGATAVNEHLSSEVVCSKTVSSDR